MEQLAAPGSIRLTAETLQLAEGFVQVAPLGPVPVKGLAEPVEVFELVRGGRGVLAPRPRSAPAAPAALDAVKRLLLRESEAEPLVVVFEDLHWIDGETQTSR